MIKLKIGLRFFGLLVIIGFQVLVCSLIVTYTKYLESAYGVDSLPTDKPAIFWLICSILVILGNIPYALLFFLK